MEPKQINLVIQQKAFTLCIKATFKTNLRRNNIKKINSNATQINDIPVNNTFNKTKIDKVMLKTNTSFSKINRVWRQDIRAETNVERKVLRNQKNAAREQKIEEIVSQNHRNL
ncbi:hypothetical protein [Leuconostoc citreum]